MKLSGYGCLTWAVFFLIGTPSMVCSQSLLRLPIIVDHNAVREFDNIPSVWLEAAKILTMHYAHTSHGSQIISGITAMETKDPIFSVAVRISSSEGLPALETPPALRIYDGNPPETYIQPADYWDSQSALDRTRTVASTGHYDFSMWSWCGEQSSNSTSTVQRYLDNLNGLENQFPEMRFIYMTGHTDGSNLPNTPGTLKYNNRLVREYSLANNKVLFDFEDIESYDPNGTFYPTTTDSCSWCTTWCTDHPSDCLDLPSSCAHSHPYNCKLKAKAFWWMMARLAGWGGTSQNVTANDIDGDGKADIGVWRPSDGYWYVIRSSDWGVTPAQWGSGVDVPVPGDYDGDGKTDIGIWRPSTGYWYIIRSSNGAVTTAEWGSGADKPVPGDYDGDGKTDIGVWRPSNGYWYVIRSSDGGVTTTQWGSGADKPVPGDYDGDGKTDIGIWRPSNGYWYIMRSFDASITTTPWGSGNDKPIPMDYDGDGKTDIGIWRPSTGYWYIIQSSDGAVTATQWGSGVDVPVPGDYDGDGKADIGIWRPSNGYWYILRSSNGGTATVQWGSGLDVPTTRYSFRP